MKQLVAALTVVAVFHAPALYANRGFVPFDPSARIFEPNQRAIIAWNGREEILVLSTDVYASKPTKVLEVLPVPCEPVVKKGDHEVFERATALINSKIHLPYARTTGPAGTYGRPAGEVTLHERIGAHDISVTHVLDADGFCDWAEDYLRSAGADTPLVPASLRSVIREYIKDGFTWFVYDVVDLGNTIKTNDPIQYRFATDTLFYPLKITLTDSKRMLIDLIILTPELLTDFPALPRDRIHLRHDPITITRQELRDLSRDIEELLGHRANVKLRIWQILGQRRPFRRDLIAR